MCKRYFFKSSVIIGDKSVHWKITVILNKKSKSQVSLLLVGHCLAVINIAKF
jgi:hypothetical protein